MSYNFTYEQLTYNLNFISLKTFDISICDKSLFEKSSLILSYGQIYGLNGKTIIYCKYFKEIMQYIKLIFLSNYHIYECILD
jgi:hypothetical protein